ncbi:hypothetical protein C8R48DRAFT_769623 [Suillus tomentosus]|nr:hypothetical protein C8R48DRAFT_769623 [Suillus tomentosus]
MSSHYNLRSQRSTMQHVEQMIPGTLVESPLTENSTNDATPTPSPTERSFSRLGDSVLRPVRSYSDVVRTRPDTPQPEAGVRSASVDSAITGRHQSTGVVENDNNEPVNNPFVTTSESSAESDDGTPWKTVKDRRIKSRRAAKRKPKTKDQVEPDLVREAEKHLTQEEKQCISDRRRVEERARISEQTSSSHDEGPSKGKGVDPRNWGNADLEESEVDPEAQREALATWARSRTWANEESAMQTDSDNEPEDPVKAAIKATEQRMTEHFQHQIRQLEERLRKADGLTQPDARKQTRVRIAEEPEDRHPAREMVEKAVSQPSRRHGQRETPPAMDAAAQIAPKSYLG